jgi:hypothetical protein
VVKPLIKFSYNNNNNNIHHQHQEGVLGSNNTKVAGTMQLISLHKTAISIDVWISFLSQ